MRKTVHPNPVPLELADDDTVYLDAIGSVEQKSPFDRPISLKPTVGHGKLVRGSGRADDRAIRRFAVVRNIEFDPMHLAPRRLVKENTCRERGAADMFRPQTVRGGGMEVR